MSITPFGNPVVPDVYCILHTSSGLTKDALLLTSSRGIIAERESELYSDKVKEWEKNDGWTTYDSVINQIDFHNIFTQDDGSTETETGSEKETGTETSTEKGSEK